MNKGTFAKEQLMEDYLSSLLTDEPDEQVPVSLTKPAQLGAEPVSQSESEIERERVAKLLEEASLEQLRQAEPEATEELVEEKIETKENLQQAETQVSAVAKKTEPDQHIATSQFQALFFNVAGLTLALPLTELGGIHKIDKIGPLFGKPSWFMGMMLHRDENLSVVDTAKWVMPEKYNEKLAESLNYQYLIMLDDSGWGLACESLVTTATLQPQDVKWREAHGKRPWLAGMVKEKMCALINVQQLIGLLDKGLGSNDK